MSNDNLRECKFCGGKVLGMFELLDRHKKCVSELLLKDNIYPQAINILTKEADG